MQLIAQGHKGAFQEIYRRYARYVFGYSVRLLRDRAAADDVTQDVWLRVIRLASSYRGEGALKGWLLRVTRNAAFTWIRKRGPLPQAPATEAGEAALADPGPAIELAAVAANVDRLPEAQRLALMLFAGEGLSYEEIARELNTSESAVKSLIFRARRTVAGGGAA